MKTRIQLSALLALSLLWSPLPIGAQKTAADAARSREVDAEARAKNLADAQERHKVLDRFAGNWAGDFKVVQGSPPKEVPAPGTLEAHWALDNKWLQSETNFQLPEGAKFQNLSFFGYNSGAKQYKRFVLTSGDSREVLSTGTWDEAAATFVFTGPMINPYSGDTFERRDTFRFLDADQIAYKIDFVFQDKTEIHVIEGTFKRKKPL
jgi:hypothetical protein